MYNSFLVILHYILLKLSIGPRLPSSFTSLAYLAWLFRIASNGKLGKGLGTILSLDKMILRSWAPIQLTSLAYLT